VELKNHENDELVLEIDEEDLQEMNKSELIQLCRYIGVRAHRGMIKKEMIRILHDPYPVEDNPIDPLRDKIMEFLDIHMSVLKSQLSLQCDADCYAHPDAQVLLCWITNKDTIEQFFLERGE
jgi:hypothetical protein